MEETISLKQILGILKRRWMYILLMIFLAVGISVVITFFLVTPIYSASTQILVNQKNEKNELDLSQLSSNIELINTYSVIIKSPAILEKVIDNLDLDENVEQLNQSILVDSQDDSQVFSITVTNRNPEMAVKIANSISKTFQAEIKTIMNVDNVSIIALAKQEDNPKPIKPKPIINILVAITVGFMMGVGLALLLEYSDNTLKDGQDTEKFLEIPVLGTIENFSERKGKKGYTLKNIGVGTFESSVEK